MTQKHNPDTSFKLPYMPALDGLRALAVLAVFFYHSDYLWAAGGFLGVESFFVISGYLITALLVLEWQQLGKVRLGRFWLRRARRLLPALWLLLLIAPPLAARWAPDALPRVYEDVLAALAYITNWVYIGREIPYFESFARPPLLRHLWSLAVEEQFYLVWPLILWGLLSLTRNRAPKKLRRLAVPMLLAAGAATWLMMALYSPLDDPARVYYGTDTRAAGFLVGAALAMVWHPTWQKPLLKRPARWLLEGAGWAALGGLLLIFWRLNEFSGILYQGGFLLVAAVTAVLIVVAAQREGLLARVLGTPPLRWVGTRSYSIYLWHWPLIAIFRTGFECGWPPTLCMLGHAVGTAALAEFSYRTVEQPIRREGFRAWGRAWLARWRGWKPSQRWSGLLVLGLVVVAAGSGWWPAASQRALITSTPPVSVTPVRTSTLAPATATPPQEAPSADSLSTPTPLLSFTPSPSSTHTPWPSSVEVTLIGDSVMAGTLYMEDYPLRETMFMDAEKKALMEDMPDIIAKLAADEHLGERVVVHLGTNRPFEPKVFDEAMEVMLVHGVQEVFFVNVRRPIRWDEMVNERIAEGVARWPQARLIDWYTLSDQHQGWFVDDKTHLSFTGREKYMEMILKALEE